MRPVRARYLSVQARRVYDRIGRVQDIQAIYEHRATRTLLAWGEFERAQTVFEFGFGTGAFARRLLEQQLPPLMRALSCTGSRYVHAMSSNLSPPASTDQ